MVKSFFCMLTPLWFKPDGGADGRPPVNPSVEKSMAVCRNAYSATKKPARLLALNGSWRCKFPTRFAAVQQGQLVE